MWTSEPRAGRRTGKAWHKRGFACGEPQRYAAGRQTLLVGAGCLNWARPDLCGGRSVMAVPTANNAELCSHVGQGSKSAPEKTGLRPCRARGEPGHPSLPGMVAFGEGIVEAEGGLPCQLSPASHCQGCNVERSERRPLLW